MKLLFLSMFWASGVFGAIPVFDGFIEHCCQFLTYKEQQTVKSLSHDYHQRVADSLERQSLDDLEKRSLPDIFNYMNMSSFSSQAAFSSYFQQRSRAEVIEQTLLDFEKNFKTQKSWVHHGHRVLFAMYLEICALDLILSNGSDLPVGVHSDLTSLREAHNLAAQSIFATLHPMVFQEFFPEMEDADRDGMLSAVQSYALMWPQSHNFFKDIYKLQDHLCEKQLSLIENSEIYDFEPEKIEKIVISSAVKLMVQDYVVKRNTHMWHSIQNKFLNICQRCYVKRLIKPCGIVALPLVVLWWGLVVGIQTGPDAYFQNIRSLEIFVALGIPVLVSIVGSCFLPWVAYHLDGFVKNRVHSDSDFYQKIYYAGAMSQEALDFEEERLFPYPFYTPLVRYPLLVSFELFLPEKWMHFENTMDAPAAKLWLNPWLSALNRIKVKIDQFEDQNPE